MLEIRKSTKKITLAAAFLMLPAAAASAQIPNFGVSAKEVTQGHSSFWTENSKDLPGDDYEYREADPAGVSWVGVFTDAGARSWAQPGELRVKADTTADVINRQLGIPASGPTSLADAAFWDTATVRADNLPDNTPVTLVFRSEATVVGLGGYGSFGGSIYGSHTVGNRTVSNQIYFDQGNAQDVSVNLGDITVPTKVGARLALKGWLYLSTNARYYRSVNGQIIYSGHAEGEVVLKLALASASGDVYLVTDSGASYPVAPGN